MSTLAKLQAACESLGIQVMANSARRSKQPYLDALRDFHWNRQNGKEPLPPQTVPMLLSDWSDLDFVAATELENDLSNWIVQPKLDGVRVLLHIQAGSIRITGRNVSQASYRLSEHHSNLQHLSTGLDGVRTAILDGELVCPVDVVDTGETVTTNALQAAVAILAASPEKAMRIQVENSAQLQVHAFDILCCNGQDLTSWPLVDRLQVLEGLLGCVENPNFHSVPMYAVNKSDIHDSLVAKGGEGTVWKRLDQPYESGRRVKHWIKRKRKLEVEAFVSGFKLGSHGKGNENLVGAVEFSVCEPTGSIRPIAWVSNWSDEERSRITMYDSLGVATLDPALLNKRAIVGGQDIAGRSKRVRHAKLVRWC